ncbi:hypothetical protein C8Q76DRAFT_570135, partial [Earliella scabrosa]
TEVALDYWKERPVRPTDIPFKCAVETVGTADAWVEFRQQAPARWVLCVRGSDDVAVISHAGLFAGADHYLSGNFVPAGEAVPLGMRDTMVERTPSFRCNYTYAFDTDHDDSLYRLQALLESHVEKIEGFNTSRVPRSDYQSGADAKFTHRFRMRAPIFVPRSRDGDLPFPPVDCHPWILEAASKSSFYAINPARPRLFGIEDGRILDLARCAPNRFVKGDIVLAVFTVTVVVSKKSWGTQLCPVELVRVANSDPTNWLNPADYAVPVIDSSVRASLADGEELKGQS